MQPNKLIFFMFLYPAKRSLYRNKSNVKILLPDSQEVLRFCRKAAKEGFWCGPMSMGHPGSLFQPQSSYCSHHHSEHTTLLCSHISSTSVQPLPPTGHPEACWNTMPVLAQAPTSGPSVEVTSSGKNGIVSMEMHNNLDTLVICKVLRKIQVQEEPLLW